MDENGNKIWQADAIMAMTIFMTLFSSCGAVIAYSLIRILRELKQAELVWCKWSYVIVDRRNIASSKSRQMQGQLFRTLLWQVDTILFLYFKSHWDNHSNMHVLRTDRIRYDRHCIVAYVRLLHYRSVRSFQPRRSGDWEQFPLCPPKYSQLSTRFLCCVSLKG